MPAPLAKGIIIAASVLVAAGIAAYENPQFREWFDRSREKIAVAFNSLGNDGRETRPRQADRSMSEDQDEKAEERRRQARQEILEKGRLLHERSKKRKTSSDGPTTHEKRMSDFNTMVDEEGNLRASRSDIAANSSAVEAQDSNGLLRPRHTETDYPGSSMHQSVDAPMLLRQFGSPAAPALDPWESRYEQEMRNTWNIPLPERVAFNPSTHASESLIDLTPTTEDFPDPEVSVPSLSDFQHPLGRTEYFSVPPSRHSRTISDAGTGSDFDFARAESPLQSMEPRPVSDFHDVSTSGSTDAHAPGNNRTRQHLDSESEDSFSDFGDGMRTPASVWTDVGSTVSGDA